MKGIVIRSDNSIRSKIAILEEVIAMVDVLASEITTDMFMFGNNFRPGAATWKKGSLVSKWIKLHKIK